MTDTETNERYGFGSDSLRTKRFDWETAELVGTGYANFPAETHKCIDWYVKDKSLENKYFVQTEVQRVAPILQESGSAGGTFQDGWNTVLVNAPYYLLPVYQEIERANTAVISGETEIASQHLQSALTEFQCIENEQLTWNDILSGARE